MVQANGMKANLELTREKFEEITSSLLRKTIDLTNHALEAARKKGVTQIDEIILVGGSCKMPQVKAAVEEAYPNIPIKMFDPNEAVAKGAALHADSLLKGQNTLQEWKDELEEIIEEINKVRGEDDKIDLTSVKDGEASKEDMDDIIKEVEERGGDAKTVKI